MQLFHAIQFLPVSSALYKHPSCLSQQQPISIMLVGSAKEKRSRGLPRRILIIAMCQTQAINQIIFFHCFWGCALDRNSSPQTNAHTLQPSPCQESRMTQAFLPSISARRLPCPGRCLGHCQVAPLPPLYL